MKTKAEENSPDQDSSLPEPKVMTIWEHLHELRVRLVRAAIGIVVTFAVTISFSEPIIAFLSQPLVNVLPPNSDALHFTDPLDVFTVYIKIGILGGLVLGSPIWIYQFWKFVEPALYPKERKFVAPFATASIILFLVGISFCFFYIVPLSLEYLITLGGPQIKPLIAVGSYFSLLILMVFGFGLVFEAPLVLVLLALLDLVQVETLTKNRRMIIVLIFIIAAIATPPDPLSQTALAIPMYIMFEVSILVIKLLKRKQVEAASA